MNSVVFVIDFSFRKSNHKDDEHRLQFIVFLCSTDNNELNLIEMCIIEMYVSVMCWCVRDDVCTDYNLFVLTVNPNPKIHRPDHPDQRFLM